MLRPLAPPAGFGSRSPRLPPHRPTPRRGFVLEHAWVQAVRGAVGSAAILAQVFAQDLAQVAGFKLTTARNGSSIKPAKWFPRRRSSREGAARQRRTRYYVSDAYVQQRLGLKNEEHDRLLQRIPFVQNLQAHTGGMAVAALLSCSAANYLLRSLPPATTAIYASTDDAAVRHCLSAHLGFADAPMSPQPARAARHALQFGGPARHAAYWASWMDTLPVIQARAASAAERPLAALRDDKAAIAFAPGCDTGSGLPNRTLLRKAVME